MKIEIPEIRRILRDGGAINRDALNLIVSEMATEIEVLRAALRDAEHKIEAGTVPR